MSKHPDERLIAQVQALYAIKGNKSEVSRMMGLSRNTVTRYLEQPMSNSRADELRALAEKERERFTVDAWEIIHAGTAQTKKGMSSLNARDSAVVTGIMVDKLKILESTKSIEQTDNLIILEIHENTGQPLSDTVEVPAIECPIQGDSSGGGIRKNIYALPGSSEQGFPEPGVDGDDSSLDLPELK